jgi:hypothetical protein
MANRIHDTSDFWVSSEADFLGNGRDGIAQNTATRNVVYDTEGGLRTTQVLVDGDLRQIDGNSTTSLNPLENNSGNATTRMSQPFLLRWVVRLLQRLVLTKFIRDERTLTYITGVVTAAGPTTILAVPPTKRARIVHIRIQNESGNIQSYTIREGTQAKQRLYSNTLAFGLDQNYDSSDYVWLLADGEDLIIDASTSDTYSYTLGYLLQDA